MQSCAMCIFSGVGRNQHSASKPNCSRLYDDSLGLCCATIALILCRSASLRYHVPLYILLLFQCLFNVVKHRLVIVVKQRLVIVVKQRLVTVLKQRLVTVVKQLIIYVF